MILTVHNRELVLSRYQAKQLCFDGPRQILSLTETIGTVSEDEEEPSKMKVRSLCVTKF